MPRPGLLISNRYLLDERVASGGMGEVWRGTDPVLQRTVAVKVLLPALRADDEFITRFRTEARMMAALRHAGIVQIFDYGADSLIDDVQRDYLVMEYVEGASLAERIKAGGTLSVDETLSIVAQAAEALQVAHDAGIVHRDVKPNNLMVRPDGSVVLLDFGVARSVDVGGITKVNQVVGSPQYMAPEQVAGLPITAATDVHGLGAVAYTCLTGRAPFTGENPAQVIAQLLYGEPAPLPPDLPPAVSALIQRAMSKDAAHRFPRAADLAAAARAAQEGPTVVAAPLMPAIPPSPGWSALPPATPATWPPPPTALSPTAPPPTSAPPAFTPPTSAPPAFAAAFAAPGAAPGGAPPSAESSATAPAGRPGRPDAWTEKRRSKKPLLAGIAALVIGVAAVTGALSLRPRDSADGSSDRSAPVSAAAALEKNHGDNADADSDGQAAGQPSTAAGQPSTGTGQPSTAAGPTTGPSADSQGPDPTTNPSADGTDQTTAPAPPPTTAPAKPPATAPKPPAAEINKAVAKTGKPGAGPCSAKLVGGYGCYQTYGDVWWVFDTKGDGHSAVVFWEVGSGATKRKGQCANSMGSGKTGVCNKNYAEGLTGTAKVCIMDWDTKQMHGCTANFKFSTS
ncbi:protein kinase [Cryptosporangium sp. NPDC051539]|uniref:serine/threonine-protein kinase n=1 Tax=Cryptosporangium sp. NPDC051539 TaxID=3363962 RepID=UPI00379497D6